MTLSIAAMGIKKRFGAAWALDGVDMAVPAGELHAVIGPNGAGKSTLFGVIAGEYSPDGGRLELNGRDISATPPHTRVHAGIARTFQITRIFPRLTLRQNVLVAILARSGSAAVFWRRVRGEEWERAEAALALVGMEQWADRRAQTLAQGDRKRLEIATALALKPHLLLLDEPTAGMSPDETAATMRLVEQIWEDTHVTVLLTEHDMPLVFGLAQQVTVMHRGRVVCSGTPDEIRSRTDVREIYLGFE